MGFYAVNLVQLECPHCHEAFGADRRRYVGPGSRRKNIEVMCLWCRQYFTTDKLHSRGPQAKLGPYATPQQIEANKVRSAKMKARWALLRDRLAEAQKEHPEVDPSQVGSEARQTYWLQQVYTCMTGVRGYVLPPFSDCDFWGAHAPTPAELERTFLLPAHSPKRAEALEWGRRLFGVEFESEAVGA